MTLYETNLLTAPGRDARRTITRADEIAWLERWLADVTWMASTEGYKRNVARLAELKGER